MNDDRPWICTYTGKQHFITDPDPSSVDIDSIAHALSLLCRFAGHCRSFYSVGEHSGRVSRLLQRAYPNNRLLHLQGLIHDGSEAFCVDIPRPLKESLPAYKEIEAKTQRAIHKALEIAEPNIVEHQLVKWADNTMLATERRDLLNHQDHQWNLDEEPDDEIIHPWPPERAEREFLWEYNRLRAML